MLVKIEDVQLGDYVSVPLYLVENTRLPYQLFRVDRIRCEENDDLVKRILYNRDGKPLLERSQGTLVQYRGELREGVTIYKTGDRLPAGDLRPLVNDCILNEDMMMQVHEALSHFQFIKFDKNKIRYKTETGVDQVFITFYFMHTDTNGEINLQLLAGGGIGTVMVVYETPEGKRGGNHYEEISELKDIYLE